MCAISVHRVFHRVGGLLLCATFASPFFLPASLAFVVVSADPAGNREFSLSVFTYTHKHTHSLSYVLLPFIYTVCIDARVYIILYSHKTPCRLIRHTLLTQRDDDDDDEFFGYKRILCAYAMVWMRAVVAAAVAVVWDP